MVIKKNHFLIVGILCISFLFGGCSGINSLQSEWFSSGEKISTGKPDDISTHLQNNVVSNGQDSTHISPTAVIVIGDVPTGISPLDQLDYIPAGDPVQFVFPTPGPAPVSAWRPPLYPVPWALSPHDHFYLFRPISANDKNWPLASYRYGYVYFKDTVHTGVDIPNPLGTPVLAAGPGVVVWAGYGLLYGRHGNMSDPYGLAVAIRHDFGYNGDYIYTMYGHMSRIYVNEAQRVATGDHIGAVGNTGESTGPHLHFEVRLGRNWFFNTFNPELWMSPPQGWGVLVGRVMDSDDDLMYLQNVIIEPRDGSETRTATTYGPKNVNSDHYYNENMVLGDLPAGRYLIKIEYQGHLYIQPFEIRAGQVNYFTFHGENGYNLNLPPEMVIGKKVIPNLLITP